MGGADDNMRWARMALLSSSISLLSAKTEKSKRDKELVGPPWPTLGGEMVGSGSEVPMGMSGAKTNRSLNSKCCPS